MCAYTYIDIYIEEEIHIKDTRKVSHISYRLAIS